MDLVITDYNYMLALLHVLHVKVFRPGSPDFMKIYKQLKLKMKLAYEAWNRQVEVNTLLHYAVLKTLQQKMADSTKILHKITNDPLYNDQHRLYCDKNVNEEDSNQKCEATLANPSKRRLRDHIRIMTYQLNTGFLNEFFH